MYRIIIVNLILAIFTLAAQSGDKELYELQDKLNLSTAGKVYSVKASKSLVCSYSSKAIGDDKFQPLSEKEEFSISFEVKDKGYSLLNPNNNDLYKYGWSSKGYEVYEHYSNDNRVLLDKGERATANNGESYYYFTTLLRRISKGLTYTFYGSCYGIEGKLENELSDYVDELTDKVSSKIKEDTLKLPMRIDEFTTWESMETKGKSIYYIYTLHQVDTATPALIANTTEIITNLGCTKQVTKKLIDQGFSIYYKYINSSGDQLFNIKINNKICKTY